MKQRATMGWMAAIVVLASGCTAQPPANCDIAGMNRVLAIWDQAQDPRSSVEPLRTLFEPAARVIAVSPAATHDRSAAEYIQERLGANDPAPLAYEFEAPQITCEGERLAKVVRRGCQVSKLDTGLFDVSQTERIELSREADTWLIRSVTSHLDAVSVDGRQLFQLQAPVRLASCAKALER